MSTVKAVAFVILYFGAMLVMVWLILLGIGWFTSNVFDPLGWMPQWLRDVLSAVFIFWVGYRTAKKKYEVKK